MSEYAAGQPRGGIGVGFDISHANGPSVGTLCTPKVLPRYAQGAGARHKARRALPLPRYARYGAAFSNQSLGCAPLAYIGFAPLLFTFLSPPPYKISSRLI